ncbi:SRPBCC family protein [Chitinophaga niabensis]|uniref:Uncharacterized conserved protein YndB, AHSA1/START domain n=1 Tax=Chitinophaga niabensis TaxID=536979 RepID=A0A1N6FPG1_9BACT|nr:SRPBCC domain-containing protein [Chitinophaga niabensis]SIN97123.1 Uncharacterized conserved protein YndB, AHSA1/START domain [Chitinophaga niabensis]
MQIEKSILINATPAKVWEVFTNPEVTRKMGGEYISDWKAGSSFGWKGADGKMYTQGVILQIIPNQLLQHHLFRPEDGHSILSTITYEFLDQQGSTLLLAKEDPVESYEDASAGWDAALQAVKELAEGL